MKVETSSFYAFTPASIVQIASQLRTYTEVLRESKGLFFWSQLLSRTLPNGTVVTFTLSAAPLIIPELRALVAQGGNERQKKVLCSILLPDAIIRRLPLLEQLKRRIKEKNSQARNKRRSR